MILTLEQKTTLRNYIATEPTFAGIIHNSDGAYAIAEELNKTYIPNYYVFSTDVLVATIYDKILWARFTPTDIADNTILYQNRALMCQLKLDVLQTLLLGRTTFDASKPTQVQGLKDALTALPSGTAGATLSAGWTTVQDVLYRKATLVEKVLATGTGTTAQPSTLGAEGWITPNEIMALMEW